MKIDLFQIPRIGHFRTIDAGSFGFNYLKIYIYLNLRSESHTADTTSEWYNDGLWNDNRLSANSNYFLFVNKYEIFE